MKRHQMHTALLASLLILTATGCITTATITATEPPVHAVPEGWFQPADFGACADGKTDDTQAIQQTIDAATETGGTVYLAPGHYRVAGSIILKPGVTLRGTNEAPMSIGQLTGTVIEATGGRDDENAPPLFQMLDATTALGITIWYPEQLPTDIHPYPWTFHLAGFDTTVENVTFINSYNGICTGPDNHVRHRIRSVAGCVLRRGIFVDGCTDIGRVENVQFHCHWWSNPATGGAWDPVFNYMVANLEAFTFGRTDWEYITNNFVFPAKIGYRFVKTEKGACNGHFTANGADACETALQVDQIQPMGMLITGGQFVAFTGVHPVEIRVAETCTGNLRFVNCAFWGPADQNAILKGQGNVSFSDCYFSSDKKAEPPQALISNMAGRLQVQNCTFATHQPAIELGPNTAHAIIEGCNSPSGVRVIDHTNGKAILANNEPPKP